MFFVGVLPALVVFWIHSRIEEPSIWTSSRGHSRASLGVIFSAPYRRVTAAMIMLSFCTLYAYWAFNFWVPAYLSLPVDQSGIGLSPGEVAALLVAMNVGGWFGYVLYGYVSDRFGRRPSFVAYFAHRGRPRVRVRPGAFGSCPVGVGTCRRVLQHGLLQRLRCRLAELYPTSIRAAATGFTFNIGRVGSALAPLLIASFAERSGFGVAFATTSAALVLGALAWFWIPETRGRTLS